MANPQPNDVKTMAVPEEAPRPPQEGVEIRTMMVPEEPATKKGSQPKNPFGSR